MSPLELLDGARHRTSATPNEETEELREVLDCENEGEVRASAFVALDSAEAFLRDLPEPMLGGLPVNTSGIPVDRTEDMASLRPVLDGGGSFPDFPECLPEFGEAGGLGERRPAGWRDPSVPLRTENAYEKLKFRCPSTR